MNKRCGKAIANDKSKNIFMLSKDEYKKLLTKDIQKNKKEKCQKKKPISKNFSLDQYVEYMYKNESDNTIKDHK